MSGMMSLAKRNMLNYFRDKSAVMFSLMAVLIVVLLYLLFLRNMLIDNFDPSIMASKTEVSRLIDSWVLAGILGIVSVTTSAGSLQTMIDDKVSDKVRDFKVTPMSPTEIAGGYILSTFIIGLVMSAITLAIAVAYLFATGCAMSASSIGICALLLIPSSLSGSIIIYTLMSFCKTSGAFSGFFAVISLLIGFLAGIYLPMGSMSTGMQVAGTFVPASHMAALFRQNLCSEQMDVVFHGASVTEFREKMGFDLSLGGYHFTAETMMLYVLGVTALFFIIAVIMMRRK